MTHETVYSTAFGMVSRRRFLAAGAGAAAAIVSQGCAASLGNASNRKGTVYSSDFVPDGALFTIALVADHHYWPHHMKDWGEKMTSHSEERMRDLIRTLNAEPHDVSIHCGDLIDAGNSFEPPHDVYIEQLDFIKTFLGSLNRPSIPVIGNHEVPDALYESEAELDEWKKRFGQPYRYMDIKGWRLVTLNIMVPNPGEKIRKGQAYGIEDGQVKWLEGVLADAKSKSMKALLFFHVPPKDFTYKNDFEKTIADAGCVRGIFCGHTHTNSRAVFGGAPVFVRASNAASPMGYSMIHVYPDGRLLVVQKSQILPYLNYYSQLIRPDLQRTEADRYYTDGGSTEMPLRGLLTTGDAASAVIRDGHLSFRSDKGRSCLLFDFPDMSKARLKVTAVKDGAARMGVIACADRLAARRIEGVVTSTYGTSGNVYLASCRGEERKTLDRSWFNITDGIAYEFSLEVRGAKVALAMKNMPSLAASLERETPGRFGIFVENGGMHVTGMTLERL